MRFLMVMLFTFSLVLGGCGKSVDQIKRVAHELIDTVGTVYEDVIDNVDTVKDVLKGDDEAPSE